VRADLSIEGHSEVFVAGDLALVTRAGQPVPGTAAAAKQMGRHIVRALRARLRGLEPPPFRYRHYGMLATVGRRSAVIELGRLRLSGVAAWWLWLGAHIFFLIGFRNRLVVLIDWASAYWTYRRNARIIIPVEAGGAQDESG
jgi:NADH dehydrogenase